MVLSVFIVFFIIKIILWKYIDTISDLVYNIASYEPH
jgi:hypothetical protein